MVSVRVLYSSVVEVLGLAFGLQNQSMSVRMIGTDVRRPDAQVGSNAPEQTPGMGVLFVVLAILTALGLGALVVVSPRSSDPILLAIL